MSIDKIKETYAKEQGFENWSEFLNNIHGFHIPSHMTEIAQRYAQYQTQELTNWKESMMKVHSELDLQGIGTALELPLGSSIAPQVLPKIIGLKEQNAELVEMLKHWFLEYGYGADRFYRQELVDMTESLLTKYNHLNKK